MVYYLMINWDMHIYRLIVYLVDLGNIRYLVTLFLLVHLVNYWGNHNFIRLIIRLEQNLGRDSHIIFVSFLISTLMLLPPLSLPLNFLAYGSDELHLFLSFRRQLIWVKSIWRRAFCKNSHLWLLKFKFGLIFFFRNIRIVFFII